MVNKIFIETDRLIIREFAVKDITDKYINWLNDIDVNRYLDVRFFLPQTEESVIDYVKSISASSNILLLGVFCKKTREHIGNITFSSIDRVNHSGTIGIAIGNKFFWGKGYALEALKAVIEYAFTELSLHRLEAGVSVGNKASIKLFEKAGFIAEGIKKESGKFGDNYIDSIVYGITV